jgi:hypothetical protein
MSGWHNNNKQKTPIQSPGRNSFRSTHTHTHHFPSFFSALVAVVAGSFFPLPERVRALLLLLLGLGFFLFFFFPPFFPFQNE